jgi:hypothetical protein
MPIAVAEAVARLAGNRSSREAAAPLSESAPDLTLDQCYAIQRALEKALVERGDRVVGWKAGFTNAALQESYGVNEPVLAFLMASGVFASGDPVPVSRFVSLGLEVEMAFVMKSALAGPGVTAESALLAVEGPCRPERSIPPVGQPRGADCRRRCPGQRHRAGRAADEGGRARPVARGRGVRGERAPGRDGSGG